MNSFDMPLSSVVNHEPLDRFHIPLWNNKPDDPEIPADQIFHPFLQLFLLPGEKKRGIVLVLPGGGYHFLSDREGNPIAERFNAMGFHACVLNYRVKPYSFPAPQEDVFRAIKILRANAEKWNVIPDKIAVLGFSAGGHLAASSGIFYDEIPANDGDFCDAVSPRPDALILCYPVITAKPAEAAHRGSFQCLTGKENPSDEELEKLSLQLHVTEKTPPAFLWHTGEDRLVPPQNSILFASALLEKNVPCELHLFPHGPHGTGLALSQEARKLYPGVWQWSGLAGNWLKTQGWLPEEE